MAKQIQLNLHQGQRGGRRPGSGRKRLHSKGVAHVKREKVLLRHALHVNFKVKTSIRNKVCLNILKRAIRNSRNHGLKVIHFSLQSNHVHFILEACDNKTLTKGMRSLTITFAKGVNKGRIQLERYHLHVLKSLRETRNAVHYVVFNEQRHTGLKAAYVNEYSSLGAIQNLRKLAQESKMTVVIKGIIEMNFLDVPSGWMISKVLLQ